MNDVWTTFELSFAFEPFQSMVYNTCCNAFDCLKVLDLFQRGVHDFGILETTLNCLIYFLFCA